MASAPLQSVDFIRADGTHTLGLVPVHKRNGAKSTLSIDEQAAIFEAEPFKRIDYVFFRQFSDGRSSQVAAYIVDNSNEDLDENKLARLHLQVWLQGTAPLLYIAWPSRIDILTCVRGPDFWNTRRQERQYNPAKRFELDTLDIAGEINREMQKFSAWRLADGTFWEDPYHAKLANHDRAAHQMLIQAVVEADKDLEGENKPTLRRLLLLMVLIKYLEDRHVFPKGWFGKFQKGAKSFFEVLRDGNPSEVYRLLENLERRFNGDVFDITRSGQKKLRKNDLRAFANLVEARTLDRQRYLWEQFSFEHLPVEIISHLYQRFVEGGHGTVYTPPFLASLLLDHAMPYSKITGKERILDPACGSGVFLVGAFGRLVNVWRSRNKWKCPDVDTLKKILEKSIYGIEMDADAVDLAAFSLSLAICDVLKPDVIWRDLKFERLRDKQLFESDFFQMLLEARRGSSNVLSNDFDIVIGNPPFESELTEAGKKIDQIAKQQDPNRGELPDKQVAYLFLEQALTVLRPDNGYICLIQPAGFLYNRYVSKFRTNIFQKCRVDTILDFASIRKLYEADPKTVAMFANTNKPSRDHWIDHWTFRRTISVKERICFELDHYDHHHVLQKRAETDPYVWRANLLGGGRMFEMSQRLRSIRTLEQYLEKNIKEKKWDYGEGYIVGKKKTEKKTAPFLTGKPLLPTRAFTESGIDENQICTVEEKQFGSPRKEERYVPPLVLIKEKASLPVAFWDKGYLAYRHRIVGIHVPRSHESELRSFYEYFLKKHEIYQFCCTLHGTESLTSKATAIRKQDIDLLPYPDDQTDLYFSFWEKVIQDDVLEYMAEYVRLGQNSQLLQTSADIDNLRVYSNMFVRMLGSIYDNLKASDPIFLNGLICQPFYFGDRPKLSWLNEGAKGELSDLIYYQNHEHLRTVRVLRIYDENVMMIVKPERLRYWIRSTAIRDADETLEDLRRQGY